MGWYFRIGKPRRNVNPQKLEKALYEPLTEEGTIILERNGRTLGAPKTYGAHGDHRNVLTCSYTSWHWFCVETSAPAHPPDDERKGIANGHVLLTEVKYKQLARAKEAYTGDNERYISYLNWLTWWTRWALDNSDTPLFYYG